MGKGGGTCGAFDVFELSDNISFIWGEYLLMTELSTCEDFNALSRSYDEIDHHGTTLIHRRSRRKETKNNPERLRIQNRK